jgi:hypothetical protein
VDFAHAAPFLLLAASALVLCPLLAAFFGLLPGGRLDLSRSVLVHASTESAWEIVRKLPDLHGRHGKTKDFGSIVGWSLRHGDGESAGSVWRVQGTWRRVPYWADVQVIRIVSGRELTIRLLRDSLGTERGLRDHLGSLSLEMIGPDATKITWRLRARLRDPRLLLARLLSLPRLRARLFDVGLRSLKVEIDQVVRQERTARAAPAGPPDDLAVPAPPPPARIPPESIV